MEIFKNGVGRPSNETLLKRKRVKMLMIISAILILGLGGVLIYKNFFVGKEISSNNLNAAKNPISYRVKGYNGGLNVKGKYYAKNTWISESTIGESWVLGNVNGITKAEVEVSFPKEIYTKQLYAKNGIGQTVGNRRYYLFSVITYNSSKKEISNTGLQEIKETRWTGNTVKYLPYYKTISITSAVSYAKIILYSPSLSTSDAYGASKKGQPIAEKTIYFSTPPSISITSTGQKIESDYDSYKAAFAKTGTYNVTFNVNNPRKITGYYKWFAFSDYNSTAPEKKGSCIYVNSNKAISMTLELTKGNPKRKGRVEFYRTYDQCNKGTGKGTGITSAFNVYYELKRTYTTNNGWQMLSYDINGLTKTIGSQQRYRCNEYAAAYGSYILTNGKTPKCVKTSNLHTVLQSGSSCGGSDYGKFGAYKSSAKIEEGLIFKVITTQINKGIPVAIHVKGTASSEHWVLVVGYNKNKAVTAMKLEDLWIIDPWNDAGADNKKVRLWEGQAGSYRAKYAKNFFGSTSDNYYTWSKISDAK